MRILLVDDDVGVLRSLTMVIENHGFDVATANNGQKALCSFLANPPDLVLTDIIMPVREGIETIIAMRKLCPAARIMAMSGGGRVNTPDLLRMAMLLGADDVLTKPFGWDELDLAIRRLTSSPARDADRGPSNFQRVSAVPAASAGRGGVAR
jgi:DNA-binding response OmpR family regulator